VIVAIVIAAVFVVLLVVMKWADKRDRAKGHVNRGMGDIRSAMRADRDNMRAVRQKGGHGVSPHEMRNRRGRFR
jgi:hypothetical protein